MTTDKRFEQTWGPPTVDELARPSGRWSDTESWWRLSDEEYVSLPDSVMRAILRYHPDVVRLVEAARRLADASDIAHSADCRCVGFDDTCDCGVPEAGYALSAALVPFKEVQE